MTMRRAALCLLLLAGLAPARAEVTPQQYGSIVESTITQYLRPEFAALKARSGDLAQAMDAYCRAPSDSARAGLDDAFSGLLAAWSRVEYARLGPVVAEKRLERFSFWPDPRGIGLRQTQAVIAAADESAADPATLKGKSVAVQGLQALEFVLFGTGAEDLADGDGFRCRYGEAIAANLDAIAGEMLAGWNDEDGYVALMRNPGPGNAVYRTEAEAAGDIVEILTTGFQFLRDVRIGGFVGDGPDRAKPRQAAFWRSGESLDAIRADFAGLRTLWEVSGLRTVLAGQANGPGIANSIDFEFRAALDTLDAGFPPVEEAVADALQHSRLGYLHIVSGGLWKFFAEDVMGLLGLRMGFNALDGD